MPKSSSPDDRTYMTIGPWGRRYNDLGAFRLVRRAALESLEMQDRGFGWTVEMQVVGSKLEHQGRRTASSPACRFAAWRTTYQYGSKRRDEMRCTSMCLKEISKDRTEQTKQSWNGMGSDVMGWDGVKLEEMN
eukprot:scaffold171705_cov46-Prasinocladus_malaysianus.AAC.1